MLIPALFVADSVRAYLTRTDNAADVIIFADPCDVTDLQRRWLEERGVRLCDDLDTTRLRDVRMPKSRFTPAALMRLVIAAHLAGRYEKILYLDADLTIHGDVAAIFSLDIGDCPFAAVREGNIWPKGTARTRANVEARLRRLGMTEPSSYVNSGVLYIDVERWNQEELGARALRFLGRNLDQCPCPDQDALNAVHNGHLMELSPLWNMRFVGRYFTAVYRIVQPIIVHYLGQIKPWRRYQYGQRLFEDKRAYRLYRTFLRNTPWSDWLNSQCTFADLRANIAYEMILAIRRLGGLSGETGIGAEPSAFVSSFLDYCREARFADVEQGVVVREGGKLWLPARERAHRESAMS